MFPIEASNKLMPVQRGHVAFGPMSLRHMQACLLEKLQLSQTGL